MGRVRRAWLVAVAVTVVVILATYFATTTRDPAQAAGYRCPLLTGGTDTADYADVFEWDGIDYVRWATDSQATPPPLGRQLTTVGCSVHVLTAEFQFKLAAGPWPDRSASFLPSGAPVYAIRGVPSRCRIVARDDRGWTTYTAMELDQAFHPLPCSRLVGASIRQRP